MGKNAKRGLAFCAGVCAYGSGIAAVKHYGYYALALSLVAGFLMACIVEH